MARANEKLSDADAKTLLRDEWPVATQIFSRVQVDYHWLRAQPIASKETGSPRVYSVGQGMWSSQPDGMYIHTDSDLNYLDIIVIEVCGSQQNYQDKRSRYVPSTNSYVVSLTKRWLDKEINYKKGNKRRSELLGLRTSYMDKNVPIRHLRVVYALPNKLYDKIKRQICPMGHEYYIRHSSLSGWKNQNTQKFLAQLALESHFLAFKRS